MQDFWVEPTEEIDQWIWLMINSQSNRGSLPFDSHEHMVVFPPESQKHIIRPIDLLFTNRIHPLKISDECLVSTNKRNLTFTGCNLQ
jgi:hypothetical protein